MAIYKYVNHRNCRLFVKAFTFGPGEYKLFSARRDDLDDEVPDNLTRYLDGVLDSEEETNTPQGGGSGSSPAAELFTEEVVVSISGAQNLPLPNRPALTGHKLFVNGLLQRRSYYALSGNYLILPAGLSLEAGDVVTFEYTKN